MADQSSFLKPILRDLVSGASTWKLPVRVVATGNITLSGTQTIDGVALDPDDDVLLVGQTAGAENGIWTVASGSWARRDDADSNSGAIPELQAGVRVPVIAGTLAGSVYRLTTTGTINIGITSQTWTVDTPPGGVPLTTDPLHGARGRTLDGTAGTDPLHALATSVLPGFLSAEYATNLGFYTGQSAPGSLGQFGIDASGAGVQWWEGPATVTGRVAGPRFAARRIEAVTVNGPGDTWHATDGELITIAGGGGNDVILPTAIAPHLVIISCDAAGTATVNPGGNTIMGAGGSATIGSLGAEAWLMTLDGNGNWLRFIAA